MTMTEPKPQTTTEAQPQTTPTDEVAPQANAQRPRRFDPFEMFDELQQDMARLWSQTFPLMPRPLTRPLRRAALAPSAWLPTTDVFEKDGTVVVKAEMPGLKKEDIEISLEQGDLVISGERHAESAVKEAAYYRMERSYGSFYRRIPLGFEVKPEQIQARYTDGVLEVQVPRPAQEQPTAAKIAVQ